MGLFNFRSKKKPENKEELAERYLEYLNSIFEKEPLYYMEESLIDCFYPEWLLLYIETFLKKAIQQHLPTGYRWCSTLNGNLEDLSFAYPLHHQTLHGKLLVPI